MGKAVTRHLTYAWIEYGDARDGRAFTDGMYKMGWKNALSGFPVKKDAWGVRAVDASHPLLPLRWRGGAGGALMILPNESIDDSHGYDGTHKPPVKDPIFEDFRKANGEDNFKDEIRKQNKFIADWVFSPGIKKVSDTESHLTVDTDITDFVDMIAISGHGGSGSVWGGGEQAHLMDAVFYPLPPASDRLKYVIIASCSNVNDSNSIFWLRPLRRNRPIHGFLGYRGGYPGDTAGEDIFKRFTNNLKAGNGSSNTILKAWRDAHAGKRREIWAAILHTSSAQSDTMAKWLAGQLEAPDPNSEMRWYNESNYPAGIVLKETPPDFTVNFFMGTTKITVANKDDPKVGLFPGQRGALGIAATQPGTTFNIGDTFTIKFYYYRRDHQDMNLDALLAFDTPPDVELTKLIHANRFSPTKFADAVKIVFKKSGLSETKLPFTVRNDALKHYPPGGGNSHGFFVLELVPPDISDSRPSPDIAYLREP